MDFEQVIIELSTLGIRPKDSIRVACDDGHTYSGRIIKKIIIDPVNDNEWSLLIHKQDESMCLCLKTRPDGLGPDSADKVIFLDEITSISKP